MAFDLVVEVLSPTDTASDVEDKRAEHLAAGVRLVWVVDPRTRSVTVYRPDASASASRMAMSADVSVTTPGSQPGRPKRS